MSVTTIQRWLCLFAALLAVALSAAGCARQTGGDPQLRLPADRPSALVIVGPQSALALGPIPAAISGSARSGEHVEIVDPADPKPVLASSVAPMPPSMPGPVPPTRPGAGATKYLVDQYRAQYQKYEQRLATDWSTLEQEQSSRLRSWSDSIEADVSRAPADGGQAASALAGLPQAEAFFGSLDQAGVGLSTRKVLVLVGTPATSATVTPLPPSSMAGVTVILANFTGGQTTEAEWQADFLQAGANRAVVLSPATQSELAPVMAQGLDGERGPAPAEVRFALNDATLSPAAKAELNRVAGWLTARCQDAPLTILGFADPLGSPARNIQLAQQRAMITMAYLAGRGVNSARMFAAGYGTILPAAPSNAQGAQPLDRRAVIVIDPVAGQPGC
jgi:outer membrane protein OmpA-like peptidoglycan-associated protein